MGIGSFCSYCSAPSIMALDKKSGTCRYCNHEWISDQTDDFEVYQTAANLRNEGLFDDAQELYNELLRKNPRDFRALWGSLLCKYGVVYIEKENEYGQIENRVITCFRKVADDFSEEYQRLKKYEPMDFLNTRERVQRNADAKYISGIQNKLRGAGSHFDIFICYKESLYEEGGQGNRTEDSLRAEKLHDILEESGYSVFLARIDLRGKEGADYEAEIFNAIESSGVMLVLGTKPEYLESVWMKNEWTRFLWLKNEYDLKNREGIKELIPIVDFKFSQIPDKLNKLQGFKWEKEVKNHYAGLRFRIDELMPRNIPVFAGPEGAVDAMKVTQGLALQQEGNMQEAFTLFREAAQKGNPEAAWELGCYFYNLENASDKEYKTAFGWFRKSAEGGYPKAMWQLSFMYEMGLGTRADLANAKIWERYYQERAGSWDI